MRGVDSGGNGIGPVGSLVKVIVEGVCVVAVGDGGKRKRVCDGVCKPNESDVSKLALLRTELRMCEEGWASRTDSDRRRGVDDEGGERTSGGPLKRAGTGVLSSCSMTMGDGKAGGITVSDTGRFFAPFEPLEGGGGSSNVDRMAVSGGGVAWKDVRRIGAEAGGESTRTGAVAVSGCRC